MIWMLSGNKRPIHSELGEVIHKGPVTGPIDATIGIPLVVLERVEKEAKQMEKLKTKVCKHWTPEMLTAHALMSGIYELHSCGGAAHIVTDDGNLRDSDLDFCLSPCDKEPERPEAPLVRLFCEIMKKLTMIQRTIVVEFAGHFCGEKPIECLESDKCEECMFVFAADGKDGN